SQRGGPAFGSAARARSRIIGSRAGAAGLQISVATKDMERSVARAGEEDDGARPIDALLIAGPTASGKSALALDLAEALGGVVINADSMQVYRDLRILTARPAPEEEARVPHRLYGHRDAAERCSVGAWLADAA